MFSLLTEIKTKKFDWSMISILFIAFILRFINLNYSDFQGDEIKALFLPSNDQSIAEFLFSQRKGPLQFLVTLIVNLFDPNYTNQFLVRFPFALAGLLSVYFFYKVLKLHFGSRIALFASFFLTTNGFFIAFARIAQYQSLVILFSILSLYVLSLAIVEKKWEYKGEMWSAIFWSLSLLAHYDGIFIAPVLIALLYKWYTTSQISMKRKQSIVLYASLTFLFLILAFYIPFTLYITQGTRDYWLGRLSGDTSSKLSSSYYLFTVYQPIYVVHFYLLFFTTAVLSLILSLVPNNYIKKLEKINFVHIIFNNAKNLIFKTYTVQKFSVVMIWFLVPFVFWEQIVYISGTHIYTYLLPLFIILAGGLVYLENIWDDLTKKVNLVKPRMIKNALLTLMLLFITLQSYFIYVDNTYEYPWQEEKFLFWTLHVPTASYHLSMFGFPYFRDWESIGEFIQNHDSSVKYYSTNERDSISRHYIHLKKDANPSGYYVYIRFPQSFTNEVNHEKVLYWSSKYPPIYTLSKGGLDLVNIYQMAPGPLEEIQLKGF